MAGKRTTLSQPPLPRLSSGSGATAPTGLLPPPLPPPSGGPSRLCHWSSGNTTYHRAAPAVLQVSHWLPPALEPALARRASWRFCACVAPESHCCTLRSIDRSSHNNFNIGASQYVAWLLLRAMGIASAAASGRTCVRARSGSRAWLAGEWQGWCPLIG
jgi:hypothetical protein